MTNYTAQPIVIRQQPGLVICQDGKDWATVNGEPARLIAATEILGNAQHYLRSVLGTAMARLQSGEIAAVVLGTFAGKPAQILIDATGYAAGAPERARHAAWVASLLVDQRKLVTAERDHDATCNESGEGYNPHRDGAERSYARAARGDRDFPVGA